MVYVLILILIGSIFRNWFTFSPVSSGDLSFFFNEFIVSYANPPFMWEAFRNLGFGGDSFIHQGVYLYNLPMGILGNYISYGVIERFLWFYPILLIGFLSAFFLGKVLHVFPPKYALLTSLIYMLNTYILMVLGGGQLTVVFAYIIVPLVLGVFLNMLQNFRLFTILLFSLVFSLLVTADFRFVYIFMVMALIYTLGTLIMDTSIQHIISLLKKYIAILIVSIPVVIGTQAYWILPYITHFSNPTASVGAAFTSKEAVNYFSFGQFENAVSLLHPYWPENIFGKVSFMKPEFLFLPILAFTSLFFLHVKRKEKHTGKKQSQFIIYFAFLGLLGAFLGKGSNPPFGEAYLWLFDHVPGFVMFRDSTKWYTLVAVSYAILVPFVIWKIVEWLQSQPKLQITNYKFQIKSRNKIFNFHNIFLVLVFSYLLFLIHPAVLGQLQGTFQTVTVPQEYIDYKNFILTQKDYFRVLWVPTMQRFTFYSDTHPAIPGNYFFDTYDKYGVVKSLQKENIQDVLRQSAVKYVVVADDTQKEMYLEDRKYDERQYIQTVASIRKIPWLTEVKRFGRIIVFQVENPKNHFWTSSATLQLHSVYSNPTEYKVELKNAKIGDSIIFTESFDGGWTMPFANHEKLQVTKMLSFNKFVVQKAGNYSVTVTYTPQMYVPLALGITILTLGGTIGLLLLMRGKGII